MLNRLGIKTKLVLVVLLPVLATMLLAVFSIGTLQQVRIGGARYSEIATTKDLIGDVTPPNQYLIEPYGIVFRLAAEGTISEMGSLQQRLSKMEQDYRAGRESWAARLPEGELRDTLVEKAFRSGEAFWATIDNGVLPALASGDRATAVKLLNRDVEASYEDHRAAVLQVLDIAEANQVATESAAIAVARSRRGTLGIMFLVSSLLSVALSTLVARSILKPMGKLREAVNDAANRLESANLEVGEIPNIEPVDIDTGDELKDTADSFNKLVHTTVGLIGNQSRIRKNTAEMFVNLGRRNQNLVARQLKFIDQLERSETDPDLLASLFRLDYLATRMRRNAESLLVIAGLDSPRKWKRAVPAIDVARSAASESEQFERVEFGHFDQVVVGGGAVANVVHLLAELIDNAVRYSPPDTAVTITGHLRDDRFVIGIADLGMGMSEVDLAAANARLAAGDSGEVPTAHLGLFVVSRLAARQDIHVRLENPGGDGLTAWITLPADIVERQTMPGGGKPSREGIIPPPPPISMGPRGDSKFTGSVGRTGLAMRDPSSESLNLGRDRSGVMLPSSARAAAKDGSALAAAAAAKQPQSPAGVGGGGAAPLAPMAPRTPAVPISTVAGDDTRPVTPGGFRRRVSTAADGNGAAAPDPAGSSPIASGLAPAPGPTGPTLRTLGTPTASNSQLPPGMAAGGMRSPKSADAVRSRLQSFSSGKSMARKGGPESEPPAGAASPGPDAATSQPASMWGQSRSSGSEPPPPEDPVTPAQPSQPASAAKSAPSGGAPTPTPSSETPEIGPTEGTAPAFTARSESPRPAAPGSDRKPKAEGAGNGNSGPDRESPRK